MTPYIRNVVMSRDVHTEEELNFCSELFDAAKALKCNNISLPCPNAKTYNNIAEYYSHTIARKKNNLDSNQPSLKSLKNVKFVLKRNYDWYFATLGLNVPYGFDPTRSYRKMCRKKLFSGEFKFDKSAVVKEMPSEMLQPIQSEKIIVKRPNGSLKCYLLYRENMRCLTGNKFKADTTHAKHSLSNNPSLPNVSPSHVNSPRRKVNGITKIYYVNARKDKIYTLYSFRQKVKSIQNSHTVKYTASNDMISSKNEASSEQNLLKNLAEPIRTTQLETTKMICSSSEQMQKDDKNVGFLVNSNLTSKTNEALYDFKTTKQCENVLHHDAIVFDKNGAEFEENNLSIGISLNNSEREQNAYVSQTDVATSCHVKVPVNSSSVEDSNNLGVTSCVIALSNDEIKNNNKDMAYEKCENETPDCRSNYIIMKSEKESLIENGECSNIARNIQHCSSEEKYKEKTLLNVAVGISLDCTKMEQNPCLSQTAIAAVLDHTNVSVDTNAFLHSNNSGLTSCLIPLSNDEIRVDKDMASEIPDGSSNYICNKSEKAELINNGESSDVIQNIQHCLSGEIVREKALLNLARRVRNKFHAEKESKIRKIPSCSKVPAKCNVITKCAEIYINEPNSALSVNNTASSTNIDPIHPVVEGVVVQKSNEDKKGCSELCLKKTSNISAESQSSSKQCNSKPAVFNESERFISKKISRLNNSYSVTPHLETENPCLHNFNMTQNLNFADKHSDETKSSVNNDCETKMSTSNLVSENKNISSPLKCSDSPIIVSVDLKLINFQNVKEIKRASVLKEQNVLDLCNKKPSLNVPNKNELKAYKIPKLKRPATENIGSRKLRRVV